MTKTYAITEANILVLQHDGNPLTGSQKAVIKSLPLITGEPVAMRYKDHSDKRWQVCNIEGSELLHDFLIKQPLYTHPLILQPITADDVTYAMKYKMSVFRGGYSPDDSDVIAAAVNAWIKHKGDTK